MGFANPIEKTYVFIYGTLKKGGNLHDILAKMEAVHVGNWKTLKAFDFYDLGSYPVMVTGGNLAVQGEVYRIPVSGLAYLDTIEGVPTLYERKVMMTRWGKTYFYTMNRDKIEDSGYRKEPILSGWYVL